MSTTAVWNPADHPREHASGRFGIKAQSAPEAGLDAPWHTRSLGDLTPRSEADNPVLVAARKDIARSGTAQEWLDALSARFEDGEPNGSAADDALRDAIGTPLEAHDSEHWSARTWAWHNHALHVLHGETMKPACFECGAPSSYRLSNIPDGYRTEGDTVLCATHAAEFAADGRRVERFDPFDRLGAPLDDEPYIPAEDNDGDHPACTECGDGKGNAMYRLSNIPDGYRTDNDSLLCAAHAAESDSDVEQIEDLIDPHGLDNLRCKECGGRTDPSTTGLCGDCQEDLECPRCGAVEDDADGDVCQSCRDDE